ncbi:EAL domain-containing protein [uncultured Thiodictyon sp.]|uniref:putative bifunctional diguanylate cyclase/phosphodiesterase n=1 Tax=uncultured Thiodictyon sp. TaxID=1846217 RepID=UPI0025DED34E|nr:EAL domain-containing protein [uncultured Thiodictyon sp.]
MRLQLKLAMVLVPLVAGPVLALGWLSYHGLSEDLEEIVERDLDGTLEAVTAGLHELVETARTNSTLFAAAAPVERYARNTDEQERTDLLQAPLLKLFYQYRDAYPEYREIRFLRPDGTPEVRVAAPGLPDRQPAGASDPGFAAVSADPQPVSLSLAPHDDGTLRVYRRIALADNFLTRADTSLRTRGYLALRVSLDPIYARLRARPFGIAGQLILALPDGEVLFDSSNTWTGQRLPPELLTQSVRSDPANKRDADPQTWTAGHWLFKVRLIPPGVLALAALPEDTLTAPLNRVGLTTLALTALAVLLLIAVLGTWLWRLVLRPLALLRDAAGRIGAGALRTPIPIDSRDEIGALAAAVRAMDADLAQRREEIERLAFHDPLTGLPNRRLISELLTTRIAAVAHEGRRLAVLFLDLDNFKQINDGLGHGSGDALLLSLAGRLEGIAASSAAEVHVGRFGGDEFLIVADRLSGPEQAADLAQRILTATAEPFDLGDTQYIVTASIGIALHPQDASDADNLIRCADLAMYGAKARGRNALHFFSADLDSRVAARLQMENQLRLALMRHEISLHYQPIVDLKSGRPAAFEALLRWDSETLGAVPPERFIPLAEETGLIREIGCWVLGEVCRQIVAWRRAGLVTVPVAVNVSATQLQRDCLARPVRALLAEHQLSPDDLQIEVTESVLMEQTLRDTGRLQALHALGLAIHIDDFGTGYSSLAYLQRLAVDCIKIDQGFIARLCVPDRDATLVTAMIGLAHALHLHVVAEGIETQEQLDALRALGCDLGQGYLFARPAPAAVAALLLDPAVPA